MAEASADDAAEKSAESSSDQGRWSQIWHVPTLLLGLVLMTAGILMAMPKNQENDFPGALDSAEQHLKLQQFEPAAEMLQLVTENLSSASEVDTARHWALRADMIFLEQRAEGVDFELNHKNILRYYESATDLGLQLEPIRLQRMAQTLVSLNRSEQALEVIDRLQDQAPKQRYQLVRQIIERLQDRLGAEQLLTLLHRFDMELRQETDMAARRQQVIWSSSQRSKALLRGDDPLAAITFLTQKIQRLLPDGEHEDLAELYLLLAQANQRTGEFDNARMYYLKTQSLVDRTSRLNADVLVGLGQLDLIIGDKVSQALQHFQKVVNHFPNEPAFLDALLGQGDCEAKLGMHSDAIEHLGRVAEALLEQEESDPRRQALSRIVQAHFALNYDKADFELALDYLTILKLLWKEALPQPLLERFAGTHERLGEKWRGQASTGESIDAVDVLTQVPMGRNEVFQHAAHHFEKAAEYYHRHAEAVTIVDDEAHGRSLWRAAECYDKAQLWDGSIKVYTQFVKTRASDQLYLSAIHRLGLAFQSAGQYRAATEKFKELVEHKSQSQVAIDSLVPLARCHIAMEEYDQAKHILSSIIEDHPLISPQSIQYRRALVDVAKLHYQMGEFSDSITRFTEVVDRYTDLGQDISQHPTGGALLFYLADAYRQSVSQLDDRLNEVLPQSVQQRYREERADRLTTAMGLFGQVISRLETRYAKSGLDEMALVFLRNAYFYQADCSYALQDWPKSISLYDAAAKRWEDHPASLVALVQIVNAYAEQGDFDQAKIANKRARFQLKRIPEKAFTQEEQTLPMTRKHWQDWLKWTSQFDLFETATGG